jgi:cytochrome c-type biogenesis protein CcmE
MSLSPRQTRFALIAGAVMVLALAAAFVLNAFQNNLVFFFTPTQVLNGEAPKNKTFRIGGLVKVGSLQRDGTDVSFVVTDTAQDIPVRYSGLLPDLFKEGKGVVAQGRLDAQGLMTASEVLAKHDENYMPPEAQHALDKAAQARAAQSLKP